MTTIIGQFGEKDEIFSNFSQMRIFLSKWAIQNFGKNTKLSRNFLTIFPSVSNHLFV